jgi:hypothetical protein
MEDPVRGRDVPVGRGKKQFPVHPLPDFLARVRQVATPDDTLMVMCRSGGRAAMAINLLAQAGFKKVYNIVDGMEGDAVEDPDSHLQRAAAEERLEERGLPVDVRTDWGPTAAPRITGLRRREREARMIDTRPQSATGANDQTPLQQLSDFSLVAGGPLYRLWRRTRLSGDALELPQRRVLTLVVLIWVPLLVLSMIDGRAWGDGVALTFLHDIETHLRLLIAAPLLILAEVVVHRSLLPIVRQFVDNGLIRDEARAQFDAAIASALRLRNSVTVELLLVVFVYAVGMPLVWRDQLALDVNSWYATVAGGDLHATNAGRWLVYVSMPVLQFLTLRWYFRFFVWGRFLWQVSRTRLNLEPTHPDGTAGLLFLARSGRAYRFVLLALGTMLSGMIANRIFHDGATLLEFKVEIVVAWRCC